ncbi:Uncharacterised protein [Moraxella lacunata]|uniref:Uncharacterized protein n=1 Tax=Moraxella lacunata TaxID=477 RepID=A0A378QD50_MORLA|nr:hypothetical protein [Moraxella lacunata]STY98715.1 Uncharacterised protein [Moraxella lacunata]
MSEQKTPYNQIDFVVKAPRFRIVFSYMGDKGVAFVREYLLRLLKLTPCKPEQIARYFGFNQHETQVALADLEHNKWITWRNDGLIELSDEGERLFLSIDDNSPKIPTLKEFSGEYRMELLDNNFLQKKDCDQNRQNAIELDIEPKVLSESSDIARKTFQNRFIQLMEDEIVNLSNKNISLYKIDTIEAKGSPDYFRFTQYFELLPETGEAKERHDIANIIHQDNIAQAVTEKIGNFAENIKELRQSMSEIGDDDTLKVLFRGKLDFNKFLTTYEKYEQNNGLYFLGQIYHQSIGKNKNSPNMVFDEIELILNKLKKSSETKKLYWLAPSDVYWGKQRKIHDKIQNLVNQQKNKNYDFRLYLPLPSEHNRREKQEWQNEFRDISDKVLYGFCEGFLSGNTEILFLENEFAVVCYHAKLANYPVTLPIGFMTTDKKQIFHIQKLVEDYLTDIAYSDDENDDIQNNDFGLLNKIT